MPAALLIALCCQQAEESSYSPAIRFEIWRPTVHGRMTYDKAFGVDFLEPDTPDPGQFSFDDDGGLDDPTNGVRLGVRLLDSAKAGFFGRFEQVRWRGDQTLTEDEDLGGGMSLPAGTEVESTLSYWAVEAGYVERKMLADTVFGEAELGAAVFKLDMDADAAGGSMKAGTGGLGPLLRLRLGWSPVEHFHVETSAGIHIPFVAGSFSFDFDARLVLQWGPGRIDLGYSDFRGVEADQNNPGRFSMGGPSVGLSLHF